jgi:hypothetical protein
MSASTPADRQNEGAGGMPLITGVRLGFEFVILIVFVYAAWTSRSFPELAAQFPLTIAIAGIVMTTLAIAFDLRRALQGKSTLPAELLDASSRFAEAETREDAALVLKQTLPYVLWIGALLLGIWILTFPGAVVVFMTAFLVREGGMRLHKALLAGGLVAVALMSIANLMDLILPASIWASL